MNLKLFHSLVAEGKNPGILKFLFALDDEKVIEKKYALLAKLPKVPKKLADALTEALKEEFDRWELKLKKAPEVLADVANLSKHRIELSPEAFKKYYDSILSDKDDNAILKVSVKTVKNDAFVDFDICGRTEDLKRRQESAIVTQTEIIDYEMVALSAYYRVSQEKEISLPKAIALGTIAGGVVNYISDFIDKSFEKEFIDFF